MKLRTLSLALIAMVMMSSCATMFSGTSYTANIEATKPGSEIYVNGKLKGTDNVQVRQKRKREMIIEVKNNDVTQDFVVYKTIKWGSQFANLLNWVSFVPVGTIIDFATGGIWQPEHKDVREVTKINNKTFDIRIDNK